MPKYLRTTSYLKQFQTISQCSEVQININNYLLWIIKEGFTITSIGLHNQNKDGQQKGKSSLLNEIFPVYFEQYEKKHAIVKQIPYIALKVLDDLYPLNVIDIPRDCPKEISQIILANSSMVLIHSWKDARQSKDKMNQMKKKLLGIPVICLMRDCDSNMGTFIQNDQHDQEPLKIMNLSYKQGSEQRINVIKKKIFKILEQKMKKQNSKNILKIFDKIQIYEQFNQLVSVIQNNIFDMAPLGKQMLSIKMKERVSDTRVISELKKQAVKKMRPDILKIIDFVMGENVKPQQSLLLSMLRQKIKTYQRQINLKLIRIYEFRDQFKQEIIDIDDKNQRKKRIVDLNQRLMKIFGKFYQQSILNLKNSQIQVVIDIIINAYQNQIKPQIFSIQLFWRQLFYLTANNEQQKINQRPILEVIKQLKNIEISNNFPFQIVDGDLLEMPKKIMSSLFQNREDKAVVITVLGPQSSGKSTLLNFLFGCDFATSEGRCTRGIYGTYFKFSKNKGSFEGIKNCQGLFLIDTEGLFAITNQRDKKGPDRNKFDQKLVVFCLAVSDFVVINIRGNLDKNTEKIIRLCNQRLKDLKLYDRRPEIVVVLNQNASNKKDESENEFKQIRKTIQFDLSASLSLAYQFKNYGHQQISILGKNQRLTKKYPIYSFFQETSKLMNAILRKISKKQNVFTLKEIIEKFQSVWQMVICFRSITNIASPQHKAAQEKIKMWQREIDDKVFSKKKELIQKIKHRNLKEQEVIQDFDIYYKKMEQLFDNTFIKGEDDEINKLIDCEKGQLSMRRTMQRANLEYQINMILIQQQLERQKIQGDQIMREKARQLSCRQTECSEKELKKIFDKLFKTQLQKIENKLKLKNEPSLLYKHIYDNYSFYMRNYPGCELNLPQKLKINRPQEDFNSMMKAIREQYHRKFETKFEEIFDHTHKINTNVLRGGRTNVTGQYFNMRQYFQSKEILQYTCIDKSKMKYLLKKDQLQSQYTLLLDKNKNLSAQRKIEQIWKSINRSLQIIGIQFPNFEQFRDLVNYHDANILSQFITNIFSQKKKEIQYRFVKGKGPNIYSCPIDHSKGRSQNNNPSPYLIWMIKQGKSSSLKCLCKYKGNEAETYLRSTFYKHINWQTIIKKIQDIQNTNLLNMQMTQIVNQTLRHINLTITNEVRWEKYLSIKGYSTENIQFKTCYEPISVKSEAQILYQIEKACFIDVQEFTKWRERKQEKQIENSNIYLPIFAAKIHKFQPIPLNKNLLQTYLSNTTQFTFQDFNRSPFRQFIHSEIVRKYSLDKFYKNVSEIVNTVIVKWNKKIQNKTYSEIINKVNQQISKFNNDMNQVSCQFNKRYIGRIHLCVVQMMWKIVISDKIQKNEELINSKKSEEREQWQSFKMKASKNEDLNVRSDIQEFMNEFIKQINDIAQDKKTQFMGNQKIKFEQLYQRKIVQDRIDAEIYQITTSHSKILQYLENPQRIILNKYEQYYQAAWRDLMMEYNNNNGVNQIVKQLYECVSAFQQTLLNNEITQKCSFQDMFEISSLSIPRQTTKDGYEQHGKRIMFESFIENIVNHNASHVSPQKICANIQISPRKNIKMIRKANHKLQQLLLKIKDKGHLKVTNLAKFTKRLLSQDFRKQHQRQINQKTKISEEDKINFVNTIRVVVCEQKCPCCGRICGLINQHQYHQCIYGHQMRGLNGSYIKGASKQKQASVIRCEDMAEPDQIQYNGKVMTWFQFKKYWSQKNIGGWHFMDCEASKNIKKDLFEKAWTIAGPIYCKKQSLEYVPYNKVEYQKKQDNMKTNIHYIFALDSSSSMKSRWNSVISVFKDTLQKMIQMYQNTQRAKISLMNFDKRVYLTCENMPPQQVKTFPTLSGCGTNFDNPLKLAAQIAKKYISKSTIVIIFMSDGQANYPKIGLYSLEQLKQKFPQRLIFRGIEFGKKIEVLKAVATKLQGTSGVAINIQQFSIMIKKYIEVIEYRQ